MQNLDWQKAVQELRGAAGADGAGWERKASRLTGVTATFMILAGIMVSWAYTSIKTYQIVCICVQLTARNSNSVTLGQGVMRVKAILASSLQVTTIRELVCIFLPAIFFSIQTHTSMNTVEYNWACFTILHKCFINARFTTILYLRFINTATCRFIHVVCYIIFHNEYYTVLN